MSFLNLLFLNMILNRILSRLDIFRPGLILVRNSQKFSKETTDSVDNS